MMRLFLVSAAAIVLAACATATPVSAEPVGTPVAANVPASASAPVSYQPPPDQQLLDLERRLSASAQDHGLGGAYASVIDPHDGFVMRPGEMYQGAAGVEHGLGAANEGPIFWQPDRVYVSQAGDMGMTSGRYVQVVAGSEAVQGRYIAVWRKDASGQWKLLSESRQADPARAHVRATVAHAAPHAAAAAHH